MRKRLAFVIGLLLLTLACNMPGIAPQSTASTPTPAVFVTVIVATPTPGATSTTAPTPPPATTETTPTPDEDAEETPTASATPSTTTPDADETPTEDAPDAPPVTVETGGTLGFADPSWELLEWHKVPDTPDWEGTVRIYAKGGQPPYRYQIENSEVSESPDLYVRWRTCNPMPATIRVWSGDDQMASAPIWIPGIGCED